MRFESRIREESIIPYEFNDQLRAPALSRGTNFYNLQDTVLTCFSVSYKIEIQVFKN